MTEQETSSREGTGRPNAEAKVPAAIRKLFDALPSVTVTRKVGNDEPDRRLTILLNRSAKMTPNKAAAQAVHAALYALDVDHGAVVVLDATATKIRASCDVIIRDAGLTEVAPGTVTAGVRRG